MTSEGAGAGLFVTKASLVRYWRRTLPKARLPPFLFEKASPLNATFIAFFSGYIANHTLSDYISSFCTTADLLCTWRTIVVISYQKEASDPSDFKSYSHNKDFKKYKVDDNSFSNYSNNSNVVKDAFKGYGLDSTDIHDFHNYAPGSNVVDEGFANYGVGLSAISEFTLYSF